MADESIDHHAYRVAHIPEPSRSPQPHTGRAGVTEAALDDETLSDEFHAELRKQGAFSIENYGKVALAMSPFIESALRAIDRAALTVEPEAGEVTVKPLEWRDGHVHFQAQGVGFLGYVTSKDADGYPGAFWYGDKAFDTLEQAKAACQADYTARIRSAIAP